MTEKIDVIMWDLRLCLGGGVVERLRGVCVGVEKGGTHSSSYQLVEGEAGG